MSSLGTDADGQQLDWDRWTKFFECFPDRSDYSKAGTLDLLEMLRFWRDFALLAYLHGKPYEWLKLSRVFLAAACRESGLSEVAFLSLCDFIEERLPKAVAALDLRQDEHDRWTRYERPPMQPGSDGLPTSTLELLWELLHLTNDEKHVLGSGARFLERLEAALQVRDAEIVRADQERSRERHAHALEAMRGRRRGMLYLRPRRSAADGQVQGGSTRKQSAPMSTTVDDTDVNYEKMIEDIGELDPNSGQWVTVTVAAKIEDLKTGTLADYRSRSLAKYTAEDGKSGVDRDGRIWRRRLHGSTHTHPFYLKQTLKKSPKS
ncbi:MAG: hypothetical protein JXQ73_02440 [Phycisphaerae bacterium]|nr:hypothetical protein [Phycisphaerae bacterium]